ncbi:sulfatase-like hydrolase/transferase [bacterium]|nr:sulfatase-like hydrolase/transferase [candidate division CSSED10-310 bacterium]
MKGFARILDMLAVIVCTASPGFCYPTTVELMNSDLYQYRMFDTKSVVVLPGKPEFAAFLDGSWIQFHDTRKESCKASLTQNDAFLTIPLQNTAFKQLNIRMAAARDAGQIPLPLTVTINGYSMTEIHLEQTPLWFKFQLPGGLLKSGQNTLQFSVSMPWKLRLHSEAEGPQEPPEIAYLYTIILGDITDSSESVFAAETRLTLTQETRPSIVFTDGGYLDLTLPDVRGRQLLFFAGYPKENDISAHLILRDGETGRTLGEIPVNIAGNCWNHFDFELPDNCVSLTMQINGSLALASPMITYDIESPERILPDIVLISIDTLRADYSGAYGDPLTLTPFIDRLANNGTQIVTAYSSAPVTNPSHASLLTGLYVREHEVTDNLSRLSEKALTLPERLKIMGYRTVGAVSVNHLSDINSGFGQGFDCFIGTDEMKCDGKRAGKVLLNEIQQNDTRPVMVFLHLFDPHVPYEESKFNGYYDPLSSAVNMSVFESIDSFDIDKTKWWISRYRSEVSDADYHAEKFFRQFLHIRSHRPCILVLLSDHGESLYEHQLFFQHHSALYEPHVKVPFIVFIPDGTQCPALMNMSMSTRILMPALISVLEDISRSHPSELQLQNALAAKHTSLIHSEAAHNMLAIWREDKKVILKLDNAQEPVTYHGYDLNEDPYELHDLLSEDPGNLPDLTRAMQTWKDTPPKRLQSSRRSLTEKERLHLKSLGYLE